MGNGLFSDDTSEHLAALEASLGQLRQHCSEEHRDLIEELEDVLREIRSALASKQTTG